MRINVVGTSGSGKSTFSRRVAAELGVPYVEMDELFWKAGWVESVDAEFFPKLEGALASEGWVLDGNYSRTQPLKWRRVEFVIYLDLPFFVVLFRIARRSLVRGFRREELWAGNRESVWKHLFTRDSMILWTMKTFFKVRKRYTEIFQRPEYAHIKFIRLRSREEVEEFLVHGLHNMSV